MQVSQRSLYAIRAVLELAIRRGHGPVAMPHIARSQAIPLRFLESIMGQLKHSGFVESRRGTAGGYLLTRPPERISVGDVLRFMDGPLQPVPCLASNPLSACPFGLDCVFMPMWREVTEAVNRICDSTTFDQLVKRWHERQARDGEDTEP